MNSLSDFFRFFSRSIGCPLLKPGNSVDIAMGAEAVSDLYNLDDLRADFIPVIYNFHLGNCESTG
jgi:hypothetical protein